MTGRLLVFNPDFEEELALGAPPPRPRPGSDRERIERRLASRFLFLGTAEDALLARFELPDAFRRRWRERGFELPAIAREPGGRRLLPWGVSPSITELAPDALPDPEVVRRVNAKPFAHELARRLGLDPPGWVCASAIEVEARLAEHFQDGGLWVVKCAFGFAGRGHLLGRGPALPPNGAGWLRRALERGDPVVLERWHARERDFSVQLTVEKDGSASVHGVLELLVGKNGRYRGNRFGAIDLDAGTREALLATARSVARELAREGYSGPAGIDAYLHDGGKLRPLVEVNARHTFGRVALAFTCLLPPGGVGTWISAPSGARLDEIGFSTDPWPLEPGEGSVVLVARNLAELVALEDFSALVSPGGRGG